MKSRMRESRTYGSVRGWHREVPVYSTDEISYYIRNGAGRISLTRFWYHTKEF